MNGNIEISKNCVRYNDEILKISNISRTWIFRFRNRERIAHENAKREYETAKARYLLNEAHRKNKRRNKYIATAIILLVVSIILFILLAHIGIVFLFGSAICGFVAYRVAKKNISYDFLPPQERAFPDKYGLGIEMNSTYVTYFTAIGYDGQQTLRKIQQEINDADTQGGTMIFNMNENHISVENNDGNISIGGNANNSVENYGGKEY